MSKPPDAVIGVRYEGDQVWIDVADAAGVHSALAPPEMDPRRVAALETVAVLARERTGLLPTDAALPLLDAFTALDATSPGRRP
jgi:hypothetical protein